MKLKDVLTMINRRVFRAALVAGFFICLLVGATDTKQERKIIALPQNNIIDFGNGRDTSLKDYFNGISQPAETRIEPLQVDKVRISMTEDAEEELLITNKQAVCFSDMEAQNACGTIDFNTPVSASMINDTWTAVKMNGSVVYVYTSDLSENNSCTVYDIASYSGTKSIESYTAFGKNTQQQKLQDAAVTDEKGFRKINDRYLVAIGSRFSETIGQYFDIVLENGTVIPCIMGDLKADEDTDKTNTFTVHTDCCSEFIGDISVMSQNGCYGNCSKLNDGWDSRVVQIKVYDYCYFTE